MREILFLEDATPVADASDLIPSWVQTMADLNRVEAENIAEAQRKYLRGHQKDPSLWFNPGDLRQIHKDMFKNVWHWAGKQRKTVTSIGIMPGFISAYLAELCSEVVAWSSEFVELSFLEKSARIHHRLVFIHPFENGNVRIQYGQIL